MLRHGPERDRRLETIAGNIRKAAQIGVKVVTYHWTLIPIRRNGQVPGRGGSTYEAFKLESDWKNLPVGTAGVVSSDDYWERITYFLQHVIPVSKQHDVRMAVHPYDPPGLPFGYQGADNWDSPSVFDAFKRYEQIVDSPYNGFQLCLGTTAEGLKKPSTDVLPIVQYLGERGKIYQIHMRNIRGGLHDFAEVYPDEGDMDFFKVMRILRDSQFAYSICADHMPSHPGDPGKLQAFAFPIKHLIIHVVPFPKGAPTAPQLLVADAEPLDAVRSELLLLLERIGAGPREGRGPVHPLPGRLSYREWGVATYKHTDHHLRQFGA